MNNSKKRMAILLLLAIAAIVLAVAGIPAGAMGQGTGFLVPGKEFKQITPGSNTLVSGAWGSGSGQFGKAKVGRGGPASFEVDPQETVYILDGLNGRVQRFDSKGTYLGSFAVPPTAEEVSLADEWDNDCGCASDYPW